MSDLAVWNSDTTHWNSDTTHCCEGEKEGVRNMFPCPWKIYFGSYMSTYRAQMKPMEIIFIGYKPHFRKKFIRPCCSKYAMLAGSCPNNEML